MGKFTKGEATLLGEKMREAQAKARERKLTDYEIEEFLGACVKAHAYLLKLRETFPGASMRAALDGGALPNSYKYPGETSCMGVFDDPGTYNGLKAWARRKPARKKAGGGRGLFYVEVRCPQSEMGRLGAHKRGFKSDGPDWVKSYV
jgi:hypothetical protein